VDCFYEAENFLAINPEECIDCGVCVPECPVGAIFEDTELRSEEREKWDDINRKVVESGAPVLAEQIAPLDDHAEWDGHPNKYEEFGIIPLKEIK